MLMCVKTSVYLYTPHPRTRTCPTSVLHMDTCPVANQHTANIPVGPPIFIVRQSQSGEIRRAQSGSMVWVSDGVWWESADQSQRASFLQLNKRINVHSPVA